MSELLVNHKNIIDKETRKLISTRYHKITKAINKDFWGIDSDSKNSFYVGSYGRGTAVKTSDIDILVVLPRFMYDEINLNKGNVQSRLLQTVKIAIQTQYPRSDIRADGQVIKINFDDSIKFEILPAFQELDFLGVPIDKYDYPDTNMGGNWKATDPKSEQTAISDKDKSSNGLYRDTCKHIRYIRDKYFSSYHLPGIVIDTFVYYAIENWRYVEADPSNPVKGSYEQKILRYWNEVNNPFISYLLSPGSSQRVDINSSKECLQKVLNKIAL